MGFFDRLYDFGDREVVRTYAMRVDVGLQQMDRTYDLPTIKGLSTAIRNEVRDMIISAQKLSEESRSKDYVLRVSIHFRASLYQHR